jgi:hypothetical protein
VTYPYCRYRSVTGGSRARAKTGALIEYIKDILKFLMEADSVKKSIPMLTLSSDALHRAYNFIGSCLMRRIRLDPIISKCYNTFDVIIYISICIAILAETFLSVF